MILVESAASPPSKHRQASPNVVELRQCPPVPVPLIIRSRFSHRSEKISALFEVAGTPACGPDRWSLQLQQILRLCQG